MFLFHYRLSFAGARRGHLSEELNLLSLKSFAPVVSIIVHVSYNKLNNNMYFGHLYRWLQHSIIYIGDYHTLHITTLIHSPLEDIVLIVKV